MSRHTVFALVLIVCSCSLVACQTTAPQPVDSRPTAAAESPSAAPPVAAPGGADAAPGTPRVLTLLHINDVYRIGGVDDGQAGGLARLRTLRRELEKDAPDLLFMHAGDLLFPSLQSRLFNGAQMIDVLNLMDGASHGFDDRMFAVFGNHEFDKEDAEDTAMLDLRVEESAFFWLGTNINFQPDVGSRHGVEAWNLIDSRIVESGGVKVGVFGLTTDMEHPEYVLSFEDPVAVARRYVADLRSRGAEWVVALTHLNLPDDVALLEALGDAGPDLVLGGHEHNLIKKNVGGRWILKADAEARSASVVRVTFEEGRPPSVDFVFPELDDAMPMDPAVQELVDAWTRQHDLEFCTEHLELPAGCLSDIFGLTNVRLAAEELELRRYETNFGNWIADRALAGYAAQGVDIAFVNSGSLRLNQDIPAGAQVTRRHVEETFQYPSGLKRVRLTGAVLQQAVEHSVDGWTGQGKWMQVSGFAFRHDPDTGVVDGLTLLSGEQPRRIEPDETLVAVVPGYLAGGNDGYKMLQPDMVIEDAGPMPTLRDLVVQGLESTKVEGISPRLEGRICNLQTDGPCLALVDAPR